MIVNDNTLEYLKKKYISITFSNDAGLNSALIKINSENFSPVKMHIFKINDNRLLLILENRFERNIGEKNIFYLGYYVDDSVNDATVKSFDNIVEKIINNSGTTETLNVYELLGNNETGKISHDDDALNIHTCIVDKPIIMQGRSDIFKKIDTISISDIKNILKGFDEPTSIKAELLKGTIEHIQYCEPIDALTSEDYKNTNISKFVDKNELINETFMIVVLFALIFFGIVMFSRVTIDGYIEFMKKRNETELFFKNKPLMLLSTYYWGILFFVLCILYVVYSSVKSNVHFMSAGIFFFAFYLVFHLTFINNYKDDNKHDYTSSSFVQMLLDFHNPLLFLSSVESKRRRCAAIWINYIFFIFSIVCIAVKNSDLSKEASFIGFTIGYIFSYALVFFVK
jgi:hypothetical protein